MGEHQERRAEDKRLSVLETDFARIQSDFEYIKKSLNSLQARQEEFFEKFSGIKQFDGKQIAITISATIAIIATLLGGLNWFVDSKNRVSVEKNKTIEKRIHEFSQLHAEVLKISAIISALKERIKMAEDLGDELVYKEKIISRIILLEERLKNLRKEKK